MKRLKDPKELLKNRLGTDKSTDRIHTDTNPKKHELVTYVWLTLWTSILVLIYETLNPNHIKTNKREEDSKVFIF